MRAQRGWRGDLRAGRPDGPGRSEGPGTARKKAAGKSSTTRGAKRKRLPVRPGGDGAGPRTVHFDGYPRASAFCSGKTWALKAQGDYAGVTPRTYGVGVKLLRLLAT